jgi:hypothetical protein
MKAKIGWIAVLLSLVAILLSLTGVTSGAASKGESNVILTLPTSASKPPIVNAKGSQVNTGNVIDILKSYPVSQIKSGMVDSIRFIYRELPQIPLEKWLGSITGDTPLEWEKDACAEYDSNIEDNDEHCVSFLVTVRTPQWHCPEINLDFDVGTDGSVYFLNDNSVVKDFGATGGMQQIADLERALAEVKAKTTPNRPSSLPAASLKAMTDQDFIMHVQALDVHSLDPSLPSERFDKWLERTAHWPLQWWQASELKEYHARCEPKRLKIRATPAGMYDPEHRTPPFDIYVDIGSWERGIEGEPRLSIYFKDSNDSGASSTDVNNLSALQKKLDDWNAALLTRKPIVPTPAKAPVVQNMTKLGYFSRIRATPGWHCYGQELSLWKYGERVFGTLYDLDGQCADSHAPTYTIRNVKFDSKTGKLEFWSYGTPGHQFVGTIDQDIVIGKFIGMYEEEEMKLKRSKEDSKPLLDSDKNVEVWCKDYAPKVRYIVEKELEELCKSLGVK